MMSQQNIAEELDQQESEEQRVVRKAKDCLNALAEELKQKAGGAPSA